MKEKALHFKVHNNTFESYSAFQTQRRFYNVGRNKEKQIINNTRRRADKQEGGGITGKVTGKSYAWLEKKKAIKCWFDVYELVRRTK